MFERGGKGWREFQATFNKAYEKPKWRRCYRLIGDISFKDKKAFRPLQAADIAAYQLHKERPRQRVSIHLLLGQIPRVY